MFSSDVVAFKCHFSFYMQRKSEKERRHVELKNIYRFKKEDVLVEKRGVGFTQHFVEHCAILVCSSHSVNRGGAVGGNRGGKKRNRKSVRSGNPVRRLGHSTRRFSLQVGVWTPRFGAPPFALLCFPSSRADTAPASEISGSLQKTKQNKRFYI